MRPKHPSKAIPAAPPWLRPFTLALAALLLVSWFSGAAADPDMWWHLKTGEYICRQHQLPVPDPFAYTTAMGSPAPGELAMRHFNLTHEWLAQAIFYLVHAAAGFPGLVLFRASLLAGFCGLAGLVVYRRCGGFLRAVAAALGAGTVASAFSADRPFVFTFLLLAATVALLEWRRRLWLLPPLFLFWANCHGGFILGWVVLGAYAAESLWLRWRRGAQAGERELWLAGALALAASLLNPNGPRVVGVLLTYRGSPMQSALWEWQPPALWPLEPFSALLLAALAVMAWRRRAVRPADWLLLAAFVPAALMAVRNVVFIGFFAPLWIASYLPWKRLLPRAQYAAAGLLLALCGVAVARGGAFQLRAAEWKVPAGAADFLLRHRITGRLFNSYGFGGYLVWRLWPQQRVFIDGRALNESVFADHRRIIYNAGNTGGGSREELLEKYGVQAIVMPGFDYTSGAPFLLAPALADPRQSEWKLVYQDAQAFVFLRTPPAGRGDASLPAGAGRPGGAVRLARGTRSRPAAVRRRAGGPLHPHRHPRARAALAGLLPRSPGGRRRDRGPHALSPEYTQELWHNQQSAGGRSWLFPWRRPRPGR